MEDESSFSTIYFISQKKGMHHVEIEIIIQFLDTYHHQSSAGVCYAGIATLDSSSTSTEVPVFSHLAETISSAGYAAQERKDLSF